MARLIDADVLREGIAFHKQYTDQEYETDRQWALGYNAGIERALFSITYAHTIDAKPVVHGRWEWDTEDIYMCSLCGEKAHVKEVMGKPEWIHCPNCGAKMDGGAEE